jgi:hypothetical protein
VLRTALILALASAVVLAACSPSLPSPSTGAPSTGQTGVPTAGAATPAPARDRVAGWRSDLAMLVPAMDRLHADLDHGTPLTELQAAVDELVAEVPDLTDDQLLVGVLHVVALVSAHGCDAHTGAFVWGTGTYPVESLPLRLWLFGDDVVIVDALPPYEGLVGLRIDALNGQPIADVLAALDPIVPRDNDQTVRLLMPRYLLIPQVLRGLGAVAPDQRAISLGLEAGDGDRTTEDVVPIPMADYNAWAGPYGLHLPVNPNVEYLSRIDDALWWQVEPDGETLFVQYNRVDHLPLSTTADLETVLHGPDVARVVLDLRHNYGGEVSALDSMFALFTDPAIDQPGRLYAITGRNTFSAASLLVARLDAQTDATLVGQAMGGCPTAYGNSADLALPFSGIAVSVSGMLEIGVSAEDTRPTIEPDIPAVLTRDEWANGSDPALGIITTVVP